MYEKYSDRARKVMHLANNEAQNLNHEYVGTEHILLAILKEGSGVACNILRNLNVDYCGAKQEVEKLVQPGALLATMGKLPLTPRVKQVLAWADEESKNLGHNYVGTEHLLLGLLKEDMGVAHQVLKNFGMHLDTIRKEIVEILSWEPSGEAKKNEVKEAIIEVSQSLPCNATPEMSLKEVLLSLKPILERQCNLLEKIVEILNNRN